MQISYILCSFQSWKELSFSVHVFMETFFGDSQKMHEISRIYSRVPHHPGIYVALNVLQQDLHKILITMYEDRIIKFFEFLS